MLKTKRLGGQDLSKFVERLIALRSGTVESYSSSSSQKQEGNQKIKPSLKTKSKSTKVRTGSLGQSKNSRRKWQWNGHTYDSITSLALAVGMPRSMLKRRLQLGWSVERAVTLPKGTGKCREIEFDGVRYKSVRELARAYRVNVNTFYAKFYMQKKSLDECISTKPLPERKAKNRNPTLEEVLSL